MSLSSYLTYGRVTGTLLTAVSDNDSDVATPPIGVAASGYVTFKPTITKIVGPDYVIACQPVRVPINPDGTFAADLIATDNINASPKDWTYEVTFELAGTARYAPTFVQITGGSTTDLATIVPVTESDGVPVTMGPQGPQGDPGPQGEVGPPGADGADGVGAGLSAKNYGAVGDGVADDTASLASWVADCLATGTAGYLPAGDYLVSSPIDLRGDGLTIFGDGMFSSSIIQNTDNVAVVLIGGQAQSIGRLGFKYARQQVSANTAANCVEYYKSYFSHVYDIYTYGGARHHYIPQVDTGDGTNTNTVFSNLFENMRMLGATITFMDFQGYNAYFTSNQFNNIYMNNKVGSSVLVLTEPALHLHYGDGSTFNVLNIEDIDTTGGSDKVVQIGTRTVEIQSLHFERVKMASWECNLVNLSACDAKISGTAAYIEVVDSTKSVRSFFRVYGSKLHLSAFDFHDILRESGASLSLIDINLASGSYVAADAVTTSASLGANSTMGTTGVTWATGETLSQLVSNEVAFPGIPVVARINDQTFHYRNAAGRHVLYGTAAPTTGSWIVGDTVYNSAPAAGQPLGWVCTVAGTPGTWSAMAVLS